MTGVGPLTWRLRTRCATVPHGFSLVELLVVLTVAAILLAIGIPNMQSFLVTNRLASTTNELVTALNLARSEAVKRGTRVVLRSAAGSGQWHGGWQVFVDADGDGAPSAGEDILQTAGPIASPLTVRASTAFANAVAFDASGRSGAGTFVICYGPALIDDGRSMARAILVAASGRVRVGADANGDRIPERDDGANVNSCSNP